MSDGVVVTGETRVVPIKHQQKPTALEELKKLLLPQALTGASQGQFANYPHDMVRGAGAWHVFSHGVAPSL